MQREVDIDRLEYSRDPAFTFPTRVDASGERFLLDPSHRFSKDEGDVILKGRFSLRSRDELEQIMCSKSSAGTTTHNDIRFDHFSFQAMKPENEDRVFVHTFEKGTLFGVFDGHCGKTLSEKASRELPTLIAQALSAGIDQMGDDRPGTDVLDSVVRDTFTRVVLEFDASLRAALDETIDEFVKSTPDWTEEEILYALWVEWKHGANRPAPAVEGSTMLIGFIPTSGAEVWVACLGDSEAWHGRLECDEWSCTPLNEMHSTDNPAEVERILKEHPEEKDLIVYNRVLGLLPVTRALGDHRLKAPMDRVTTVYKWARPVNGPFDRLTRWAATYKTPPYLSTNPTFKRMSLSPGDVIVMATDGLRNIDALDDWGPSDKTNLFVSLAGAALNRPPQTPDPMGKWETKIGHGFLQELPEGDNAAELVVRNVLFGQDQVKLARELTIESPVPGACCQDDITVLVVHV